MPPHLETSGSKDAAYLHGFVLDNLTSWVHIETGAIVYRQGGTMTREPQMSVFRVPDFAVIRTFKSQVDPILGMDFADDGQNLMVFQYQNTAPNAVLYCFDFKKDLFVKQLSFPGFVGRLHRDRAAVLFHYRKRGPMEPRGPEEVKISVRDLKERKDYPLSATTAKIPLSLAQTKSGRAIQFSPDGKLVAWAERGGKVFVCDYKAGNIVWELEASKYTRDVFFLPDGKRLITYGVFAIWDLTTGKKTFERQILMRALLPDGKHILAEAGHDWVFTDLDGREKARFTYYPGRWQCHLIAFTPDQRLMIGAGSGGEIRVWNVPKLD